MKKKFCYVRIRRLGHEYFACSFGIAISDDEDLLVVLHLFKKLFKNLYCDEFERFSNWKELKFSLMAECQITLFAILAFADYEVKICSHVDQYN